MVEVVGLGLTEEVCSCFFMSIRVEKFVGLFFDCMCVLLKSVLTLAVKARLIRGPIAITAIVPGYAHGRF